MYSRLPCSGRHSSTINSPASRPSKVVVSNCVSTGRLNRPSPNTRWSRFLLGRSTSHWAEEKWIASLVFPIAHQQLIAPLDSSDLYRPIHFERRIWKTTRKLIWVSGEMNGAYLPVIPCIAGFDLINVEDSGFEHDESRSVDVVVFGDGRFNRCAILFPSDSSFRHGFNFAGEAYRITSFCRHVIWPCREFSRQNWWQQKTKTAFRSRYRFRASCQKLSVIEKDTFFQSARDKIFIYEKEWEFPVCCDRRIWQGGKNSFVFFSSFKMPSSGERDILTNFDRQGTGRRWDAVRFLFFHVCTYEREMA